MSLKTLTADSGADGRRKLIDLCEAAMREQGAEATQVNELLMAIDEILANISMHGYGAESPNEVRVDLDFQGAGVAITICDEAPAYDPLQREAPNTDLDVDEREIGGLGIHLILQMIDEVSYEYDQGNRLTLRHRLESS